MATGSREPILFNSSSRELDDRDLLCEEDR